MSPVGARRTIVSAALLATVVGCGQTTEDAVADVSGTPQDSQLSGGGTAASSLCGQHDGHHFSGPRPPEDSTTPQMAIRSFGYFRSGASDPGRITIRLSIAAGSEQPLTLSKPLGTEGPSVEIEGPDGVEVAAYGLPVKVTSDTGGGHPVAGSLPLEFEIVVPAAATCPGHTLAAAARGTTNSGRGTSTVEVTISDPAITRYRIAHGVDNSSDLLIASWPLNPDAGADGD